MDLRRYDPLSALRALRSHKAGIRAAGSGAAPGYQLLTGPVLHLQGISGRRQRRSKNAWPRPWAMPVCSYRAGI